MIFGFWRSKPSRCDCGQPRDEGYLYCLSCRNRMKELLERELERERLRRQERIEAAMERAWEINR
jgi:hypothetical protein